MAKIGYFPGMKMPIRPRRNRVSPSLRELIAETELTPAHLVQPLFVQAGHKLREEIKTLPGQYRLSPDELLKEIAECLALGISAFALFPAIAENLKTAEAAEAWNREGLLPKTVAQIKTKFPQAVVITDVALDPYSSDGHDGLVRDDEILNDESVEALCRMAVAHAQAGADLVAPSDMMDGRVKAIRHALDQAGFEKVGILSYAVKYASGFYGPFRDALGSAPKKGDKNTYQMDPRNRREALREVLLDVQEGADIVMVKPGLPYLDIVREVRNAVKIPVAVYNVSGEYAMIKAAAAAGMMDEKTVVRETLFAFRRAGADLIFTYFAKDFARDYQA
jgi:porphobilinogen synthase